MQDAEPESPTAESVTSPSPSNSSNCTRNSTSEDRSFMERKRAMVESVREHMMAKLNLKEVPKSPTMDAAQLATYRALVQTMQDMDHQERDCGEKEETTHFSKHPRLYHPEVFAPAEAPNLFHLGKDKGSD